jgi:ferredoxin
LVRAESRILRRDGLEALVGTLASDGYRVLGPTVRDGAIVCDDIKGIDDLPRGWSDEQAGGHYRLIRRDDEALFGFTVGPGSWKTFFHPPEVRLFHAEHREDGFTVVQQPEPAARLALIGARPCDLRAIAVQDRVLLEGPFADAHYANRRRDTFVVAVNCGQAGGTCFCASMGSGPRAGTGFDLALTELEPAGDHRFLVEVGSPRGSRLLERLPGAPAEPADLEAARAVSEATAASMGRSMPAIDVPDLLRRNPHHPRWHDVASRCLTCGNCTMACPTCFCTDVVEDAALDGSWASRTRHWASCFTLDFSYVHGGSIRNSADSRYRQWLTHKLGTWHDQFGESGCVGCGRCITWCPVGIDITQEVRAIAATDR